MKLYLICALFIITVMYWGGMAGGIGEAMCVSAETSSNIDTLSLFFYCNFNLFVFVINIVAIIGVLAL